MDVDSVERFLANYPYSNHRQHEPQYFTEILKIWNPATDQFERVGDVLHRAIYLRDQTAVCMILEAGANPAALSSNDPLQQAYAPLLVASECGLLDTARFLWQLVGPEGRSNSWNTVTCLEVAAESGHADLVAVFLDIWDGWSPSETRWALKAAVKKWHKHVVTLLLARVPYDADALQFALDASIYDRVLWIFVVATPTRSIFSSTALIPSSTALHQLLERPSSSIPALRLLLEHDASPEVSNQDEETPLHVAAYTGTLERLQLCLARCRDEGAALRLRSRAPWGETILHYAAASGREDIVDFLLSRGLDVNSTTGNGWTPLMCALMPNEHKLTSDACRVARLLLQHGADARVVTEEGWTPLHALASNVVDVASESERPRGEDVAPLARELIARGAPLDTEPAVIASAAVSRKDLSGKWGSRMGKFAHEVTAKAAKMLPARPAAEPDSTPLMWAFRVGATDVFEAIMDHLATRSAEPPWRRRWKRQVPR
ncbi:ankyrin repeat-containing domain protein [Cercophora newfieldiana]|uniref:Ankyrin repeat-containing domain protein n=1 Tax=Cercophora newfieldiana TaxID=92897 RepID=A0AA40CTM4_9PEZI|nr:ankyrin repeat-containing domain protein [Cercophora newfieldiana]